MKIFFGKTTDPNQAEQGYYAASDEKYFNRIQEGDYCFMIANDKVRLWKAKKFTNVNKDFKMIFDIVINDTGMEIHDFALLKFFLINKDLIVNSRRQTKGKAFYETKLALNFFENDLINVNTYKNENNFRKILIQKSSSKCVKDSIDVQLYFENNILKLYDVKFIDKNITVAFRDNRSYLDMGQPLKDSTFRKIENIFDFPKIFKRNEISIIDLYDAFFVEYITKSEEDTFKDIIKKLKSEKIKAWYFKPGEGAALWKECLKEKVLRFGYDNFMTILLKLPKVSEDQIEKVIIKIDPNNKKPSNKRTLINNFINVCKKNDVIFSFEGNLKLIGLGQLKNNNIEFKEKYIDHKTIRKANWIKDLGNNPIEFKSIQNLSKEVNPPTFQTCPNTDAIKIIEFIKNPVNSKTEKEISNISLNTILFGPPGTGKTYDTKNIAVSIINSNSGDAQ